jgi:hypothetical protein
MNDKLSNISVALKGQPDTPYFEMWEQLGHVTQLQSTSVIIVECDIFEPHGPLARLVLAAPETLQGLELWFHLQDIVFAYGKSSSGKTLGFKPKL